MRRALVFLAAGATLFGGCERITEAEPGGRTGLLTGVVVAGADSIFVTLGRAEDGVRRGPEPGARLTVLLEGVRIALDEASQGTVEACGGPAAFSCYRAGLRGLARAGVEVTLEGTLASGEAVSGVTTIPPPPAITVGGAAPGDTLRLEGSLERRSLPILGLDDEPGRISLLPLDDAATAHGPGGRRPCTLAAAPPPGRDLRRADVDALTVAWVSCEDGERWDSLEVTLTFMRYDVHFTGWADRDVELGTGELSFGTTGVPGVFGSAAPGRIVLLVRPREDGSLGGAVDTRRSRR